MTSENDRLLIEEARLTPYWKWSHIYFLIGEADSEETISSLKNIASILFDVYQERGYYDPTEKEDLQAVRKTRVPVLRRFVSWLLGARKGQGSTFGV